MTVGERIKFLREQNNMTQTDVAKQIGIATQSIFKYEKNIVTNIPLDNIEKMAKIFGVSPSYIMGWEDSMERESTPPNKPSNELPVSKMRQALLDAALDVSEEDLEEARNYFDYLKHKRKK